MIQEISPRKFHCEYHPEKKPVPDSFLLCFDKRGILFRVQKDTGRHDLPRIRDFMTSGSTDTDALSQVRYLFSIDENMFFLTENPDFSKSIPAEGFLFEPLLFLRTYEPQYLAFAAVTGSQISRFYRSHRFCGRCGKAMIHSEAERAMVCPGCGLTEYPKISPAVIVAVRDGNRLLLTQNKRSTYPYRALIAGFVEIGETPEDTVHREVMEEAGLRVKNVRLYKMQPWAFSDTLMIGFTADLDGSDKITVQKSELTDASWFDRKDVSSAPFNISIGHEMITAFKNGEL